MTEPLQIGLEAESVEWDKWRGLANLIDVQIVYTTRALALEVVQSQAILPLCLGKREVCFTIPDGEQIVNRLGKCICLCRKQQLADYLDTSKIGHSPTYEISISSPSLISLSARSIAFLPEKQTKALGTQEWFAIASTGCRKIPACPVSGSDRSKAFVWICRIHAH